MSEAKLPSLTVSIVEDGKVVHSRAFGFMDVLSSSPASASTLYGIGSVTKSFTALTICRLAEEGKLDLHDPISKFLPSLEGNPAFDRVELHHLLSHSSGIPGLGWAEVLIFNAIGKSKKWLPISSADDMTNFLNQAGEWREAQPGSKFFYLNEGYYLLGEVISKVSGKPYYDFMKEIILSPLKMNRTFLNKEDVERDADFATPYLIEQEGDATKISPSVIPWGSAAAGGLMSNVIDLSDYLKMYINRGELYDRRIIGKEMIELMETPVSKPPMSYFSDAGYGYGLFITKQFFGEKLVMHDGSVGVYSAGIAYLPEKKIGVALLINGEAYSPSLLKLHALATILGKDPESDFPSLKRENLLRKLEGTYAAYKDTITAQVKRKGDFLIISGEDIGSFVLVPENDFDADSKEGVAKFFTLSSTARMNVEFRFSAHRIELVFERYKYRKM
jgi:CubicO group peptidase (beta-lactamase class C family)